jgi:eukaryotic-like serine/threonine-protein kinase
MSLTGFIPREDLYLDSFWIDRYEVSNRQYQEFVDQGGYANREFWEQPFLLEGNPVPLEQAVAEFHDRTGLPGPADWIQRHYPEGREDYPVRGVSWYEAAAYAKFRGKTLPTIYHWAKAAAAITIEPSIVPLSNFDSHSTVPVGSLSGIGFYGTYNMAGNVREWCFNQADMQLQTRYILGGAFDDPAYMYILPVTLSAFDRSLKNGFRCIQDQENSGLPSDKKAFLTAPRSLIVRDPRQAKPISDSEFELLQKTHFAYDKQMPLDPEVQWISTTDIFRKEKVTFNAAYGGERVRIYMFLPNNPKTQPPYPAILDFPAANALVERSSEKEPCNEYLLQKGCVWIVPVFKGMWERGPIAYDFTVSDGLPICEWVKDWERTLDYLETRPDIDTSRIVFSGGSLGGYIGGFISAGTKQRFAACALWLGGIPTWLEPLPQYDPVNFLPRIRIPVLMVNGRRDPLLPFEIAQEPMYQLLGTPPKHKYRLVFSEGEHGGWLDQETPWKAFLEFLNRYIGIPEQ